MKIKITRKQFEALKTTAKSYWKDNGWSGRACARITKAKNMYDLYT